MFFFKKGRKYDLNLRFEFFPNLKRYLNISLFQPLHNSSIPTYIGMQNTHTDKNFLKIILKISSNFSFLEIKVGGHQFTLGYKYNDY